MGKINLHKLSLEIASREKGNVEVNVAQIKEILRITLTLLAKEEPDEVLRVIKKYRKK